MKSTSHSAAKAAVRPPDRAVSPAAEAVEALARRARSEESGSVPDPTGDVRFERVAHGRRVLSGEAPPVPSEELARALLRRARPGPGRRTRPSRSGAAKARRGR